MDINQTWKERVIDRIKKACRGFVLKASKELGYDYLLDEVVEYLDKKYSMLIKQMKKDFDWDEEEIWQTLDTYRKVYGYPDID